MATIDGKRKRHIEKKTQSDQMEAIWNKIDTKQRKRRE